MCGLSGEIRFDDAYADTLAVARMTDAMAPRGPDASGLFQQSRCAFGHRRLKIIDLTEKAQQPLIDPDLGLTIAFNGCIYNYKSLRAELREKGYRFFSAGDTEVVLKAFHAWGPDCVKRLNGMFAFAIFERDTGRLTLARDRLGIKPLYLAENGRRLRFASTLPALLAAGDTDTDIDPVGLNHYMSFHAVVPAPFTVLKGVRKLPPATYAEFEADGTRTDTTYWSVDFTRPAEDLELPAEEWCDQVYDALALSIERRLEADVDVGVLLSGGVDSSLVVGMLARAGKTPLRTFSVGFEDAGGEEGNEFRYSDIIAREFGTEHYKIHVGAKRLMDLLPDTIEAMSEPMVSHDAVGFYALSQEVSRHVKVVQSGQGADEIFGGYSWYPPLMDSNDAAGDYARVFRDRDFDDYRKAVSPRYHTGRDESMAFIDGHFARPGADRAVDKALRIDSTIMLVDDPVKRVDNMTMAWGLEARVPFLDHELVELAARVPPEHKVRGGGKGVLKDVARRVVPAEVIDRPKGYFPVPALKYIDGPYLEMVRDTLTSKAARDRGLFQEDYLNTLFDNPKDHITPLKGSKLWQVALMETWLQTHGV
ncbi:MAG: N-acetylglutaminylglutamine amidotransferase [Rhodospirillales bacterium CG15_BIG_FIL_POST_REV_8_21_14_020_66_15]|nr:MAG: N-acetylglutaminylglutamine amidotransferase [Rhodospirillales bacterium CG15_BIG_FIL_POST_REV_8_21_14_020_66_15]